MKFPWKAWPCQRIRGPAPHGAGGLKSVKSLKSLQGPVSRPARGGWVEITQSEAIRPGMAVPPRTGRVG